LDPVSAQKVEEGIEEVRELLDSKAPAEASAGAEAAEGTESADASRRLTVGSLLGKEG